MHVKLYLFAKKNIFIFLKFAKSMKGTSINLRFHGVSSACGHGRTKPRAHRFKFNPMDIVKRSKPKDQDSRSKARTLINRNWRNYPSL